MIRIVLADDEALFRGALAALLDREPDFSVVAEAADGPAALEAVAGHRPDLAVLDLDLPPLDGVQAVRGVLGGHDARVVLVARQVRPGMLRRALAAGARGIVPKSTDAARLPGILRDVHAGGLYVDPHIAALALSDGHCPLTARELDVLRHTRQGHAVRAIARSVSLAPGTVRNYLSSAMTKLDAGTRHEAARRAWEEGWL
ncbi:response regulator transcription factor [Streptomyces sp. I05A-00742]|uniref:response regulator transcription factor n=1 Tax=Streptomyces sp. I05A-00742 TaxID=2732853 RepID=UPI001488A19E|nr:response regulator transcription factor [Streptomyces sp. I05A-00742]